MNEVQLSERLLAVAEQVPEGAKLADIGSDHAYLPCYLSLQNKVQFAVAGEVNEGPYQSAKAQVKRLRLEGDISVRKGDGLHVMMPGEVDVITICGMGGGLISTILEEGKDKLEGITRLILQPNVTAHLIRNWLRRRNWKLIDESILEEDGKIYEILVAERGDDQEVYLDNEEVKMLVGPYLMKEKSTVFRKKWELEIEGWKRIIRSLEKAKQEEKEILRKKMELKKTIEMVEEVIQ
ncbi:tRNA (adenine(22)-N(1))-methyltransferase [Alkalihalobacillus hemicellulosilyticus]|uniref:tRNA (adenine(22)-N(1))-methyltransferase n=1 Tax=Halalkalibacter hemicellulosilyticus TaxID=127886 RepID=UPI0005515776|nr:tRNA (adenine(22)-N(1))-methyltransferase TrmK [Halalkalibacter hemicellulosilyticus]